MEAINTGGKGAGRMYFDYAATSLPKPPAVTQAMVHAMNHYGNPARGAHEAAVAALRCMVAAREQTAAFFGVGSATQVAFCKNATEALNLAIGSVQGHIVSTAAEHNSVLRPLYKRGRYTIVPADAMGRLTVEQLAAALQPDTAAIVMTHASNVTGNVYDVAGAGRLCRERGIHLIVDASQSAGLLPIHMQEMQIDALCFSGHKALCGPQGVGVLCVGERFTVQPCFAGGSGSDSYAPQHPAHMPERLEAGTQNIHGIAGLCAGMRYVQDGGDAMRQQAATLARTFVQGVRGIPGITLYGDMDAPARVPVVTLNADGTDSATLAFLLAERYGIAVRAGAHCAPLMHRALGTGQAGAVRFSFSHMNTPQEIARAVDALHALCG